MKNRTILGLYWLLVLVAFSVVAGYAQEQTPVPPSPAVIQGITNLGNVNSLSMRDVSAQTNTSMWTQDYGITGNGVRVGILDKGFKNILDFEARAGIEVLIYPAHDKTDYNSNDATEHGTQALETIHAIAPDATLFACRYISYDDYVLCVNWLVVNKNVNIINHSGGVPAIGLDNWTDEVDFATERGVLWINSAGNFGQGVIQDYFTDQSGNLNGTPNGFHEFRGTPRTGNGAETVNINPINTGIPLIGIVMLSWDNPSVVLDLKVTYFESASPNILADNTYQYTFVDMNQPFNIGVQGSQEALNTRFMIYVEFMDIEITQSTGSIIVPANSPNALTIGALSNPRIVADYSSQGPAEFGTADKRNIIKPDLVTFGAVIINGEKFVGTSASAAITTGVAGLVWEHLSSNFQNSNLNIQVRDYLLTNVDPPLVPDPFVFGAGSLRLPINLSSPDITPISPTPDPTINPTTLTVNNPGGANIRSGPGVVYDVLYTVEQNTLLEATHYTDLNGGWFQINYQSNPNAWISTSVVDYSDAATRLRVPPYIPPPPGTPTPAGVPTDNPTPTPTFTLRVSNEFIPSYVRPVFRITYSGTATTAEWYFKNNRVGNTQSGSVDLTGDVVDFPIYIVGGPNCNIETYTVHVTINGVRQEVTSSLCP